MPHRLFFSWQSDTPTEWGRNFVERALTKAAINLIKDLTVEESVRDSGFAIDKDTKGVSGTPPIVETIFKKIDDAVAYVADLTFVGERRDGRPTPNPNVLVEYGWALKSLGYTRIITLMNTAYGEPSDNSLPFNMKHLRLPIVYHLPEGSNDKVKQEVRKVLVGMLESAIKAVLESEAFKASLPKPPEIPKFVEMEPVDGPARFRKRNEPIGVIEGPSGISSSREIGLAAGPAMWLRVMPEEKQVREWGISELRKSLQAGAGVLRPLGNFSSWSYVRAPNGFGYMPSMQNESDLVPAVILAFKTGELWSIYTGPLSSAHNDIPNIEPMFVECFMRCIQFLRIGLKIEAPYRWISGIDGLMGKKLWKVDPPGKTYMESRTGPCLQGTVTERGVLQNGEKSQLALKPFFLALNDAFGWERPDHMDAALLAEFPD
jgi:hypothetical protein